MYKIYNDNSVNVEIKLVNLLKVWVGNILENFLFIPQEIQ